MNVLSMVMGFLLIFACTFTLSMRKAALAQNVEKTVQANIKASRKILNSYESICYERLREEKKEKEEKTHSHHERHIEVTNLDCARLNLWPLIQDGKEKHPVLYETTAQLLRTFYAQSLFNGQSRMEYRTLDAILESAQNAIKDPNRTHLPLEKLALKEGNVKQLYPLQSCYYRLLRGTKKHSNGHGYPSLLDYIVIENKDTHLCLQHASLDMLEALFGSRIALVLQHEIQESKVPLLPERLRELCFQNGQIAISDEFLKMLDLNSPHHHLSGQKTLIKENADVCIKQRVYLPS